MRSLLCMAPLFLMLLTAGDAGADQVQLANGDRISGETLVLANGTLSFATSHGDLKIEWAEVVSLATAEPLLVTVVDAEPVSARIGAAAEPGHAMLEPGGAVALPAITALARPSPLVFVNGGANAGFVTSAGNTDLNNVRLDGEIEARRGVNRYTANAAVTRAEDRDVETARNWTLALKFDRFVTPRLFFNGNSILTNDRFRDLNLRTAAGVGVGYQVFAGPRFTLTSDAGLGFVNESLARQSDDSYGAARESTSVNVFVVPRLIEFFHRHDGYFGVTGRDNQFVKMQNGVRLGLTAGFVTTLRHDVDYDRSPAEGRRKIDHTFALTLGYRF
jgi:putative salt-induced outer membrane protein YdiY